MVGFVLFNLDGLFKFILVEFGLGKADGLVNFNLFDFSLVKVDVTKKQKRRTKNVILLLSFMKHLTYTFQIQTFSSVILHR